MNECLFCRGKKAFHTREHIVPESLGNDTDILENIICEKCQNYFGRKVEKPALEKTPFSFWRCYLGIKNKGKSLPEVNLDPPIKGAISAFHQATDIGVGFKAHENGSTEILINNPALRQRFHSNPKPRYHLVLTPWHLSIMGRLLGKIGLEYVASVDLDSALGTVFDEIRSFIRYGSIKKLWPIYYAQQDRIDKLKGPVVWERWEGKQEIECYRYALGKMISGEVIFAFAIGIDLTVICLTSRLPNAGIAKSLAGITLNCIYYPDGTW